MFAIIENTPPPPPPADIFVFKVTFSKSQLAEM
jgi:hypothetical protein